MKPHLWPEIKRAYFAGEGSFRQLAERYKVSFHTLAKRAKRDNWTGELAKLGDKVATTALETASAEGKTLGTSAARLVERTIRETERWLDRIEAMAIPNWMEIVQPRSCEKNSCYFGCGLPVDNHFGCEGRKINGIHLSVV